MEMWLRFAARGPVARINAVQAIYRRHSTNMSVAYSDHSLDHWHRKVAFDAFFDEFSDCQPQFKDLRALASRALAEQALQIGAGFIRSSIRLSRWELIGRGLQLVRMAKNLDPQVPSRAFLRELWRMPGPQGRGWALSTLKRTVMRHERAK
jgi:hypothetical protein